MNWFHKWFSFVAAIIGVAFVVVYTMKEETSGVPEWMWIALLVFGGFWIGIYAIIWLLAAVSSMWSLKRNGNPLEPHITGPEAGLPSLNEPDEKKKLRKYCPICKRPTFCKIKRSIGLGAWVHVHKD